MAEEFIYDVFRSHSSKDKAVVRPLAERLRKDGLKVWFDEWVLKPVDSIPAKIREGLERSQFGLRISDFGFAHPGMSATGFGSDWAQLRLPRSQPSTLDPQPPRAPLNKERRFIPLRLEDTPLKGSLAQFLYTNWRPAVREQEYAKLLEVGAAEPGAM